MAYVSQDQKKVKAPIIKDICKKYGVKAGLGVSNHTTLVLNILSGSIDFFKNVNEIKKLKATRRDEPFYEAKDYTQVNVFWLDSYFSGQALNFLNEVYAAMNDGNHNNSDSQRDYYDIGFYVNINIGKWNQPYKLTA